MFLEWTALEDIVSLSKEKVNFYTVQYEKDGSWEDKSRFLWLEILVPQLWQSQVLDGIHRGLSWSPALGTKGTGKPRYEDHIAHCGINESESHV